MAPPIFRSCCSKSAAALACTVATSDDSPLFIAAIASPNATGSGESSLAPPDDGAFAVVTAQPNPMRRGDSPGQLPYSSTGRGPHRLGQRVHPSAESKHRSPRLSLGERLDPLIP